MSGLADLRLLLALPVLGALLVALGPVRWCRAIGGVAAGIVLIVGLAVVSVEPAGLALRVPWVAALGLSFSLGLGALGVPGVLVTCLIGQVAALAPGASRGSIAGGLALQAVVLAALLARDLGLLVACYGLLAPLVAGLVASGAAASRVRAALVVGFYLSLGTALLAVAVGALAVAHHDASGGLWSLELEALGGLLLPARAEAAIAAALGLAGALTLGLWPLHGWLIAGVAAARPGVALLVAGPLRWLGFDLLLRVWLVVTPTAAAALAASHEQPHAEGVLLAAAERDASQLDLDGESRRDSAAAAALIRAGIAARTGARAQAIAHLDSAIASFDAAHMVLHAACARRRSSSPSTGVAPAAASMYSGAASPQRPASTSTPCRLASESIRNCPDATTCCPATRPLRTTMRSPTSSPSSTGSGR